MLNELQQATKALESRGIPLQCRSNVLDPMPKNSSTVVVKLSLDGRPVELNVVDGKVAGKWLRIRHGSAGSAFPGFNLPAPLCVLLDGTDRQRLDECLDSRRRQSFSAADVEQRTCELLNRSMVRTFTKREIGQFQHSVQELVEWLDADFQDADQDIVNFRGLLVVLLEARPSLRDFVLHTMDGIKSRTVRQNLSKDEWVLLTRIFFQEKLGRKKTWAQPVYLELAVDNPTFARVADRRMGELLNCHLLKVSPKPYNAKARRVGDSADAQHHDAYSGTPCVLPKKFPDPKVAVLGNVRLFANNTQEVGCFFRYGLGGSETFKVSTATVERLASTLLTIAGERQENVTCRSIPGNKSKRDPNTGKTVVVRELLCVYLEDEPDARDPFANLFGTQSESVDEADYAATAKPVLDALDGRVRANPNQLLRLFCICPLDKANKQISLNRSFTVREVHAAAMAWQDGASNCPPVTLSFFNKETKKLDFKLRTVPSPLETAVVLNKVWASAPKGGFRVDFHRIISVSDAYDIFLASGLIRNTKTQFALQVLLTRMHAVFAAAGALKATSDFNSLGEPVRWQVLKAVALIGIFLQQQGKKHEVFMKEPIYQVGRLLALADSLHFQYCKYVRTSEEKRKEGEVDAPSELLGNALFNAALDNPIVALARLAERIRPYKGWADTYSSESMGWVHTILRLMAKCEKQIDDLSGLPKRMEDVHKAQLLLGYLADNS